MFGFEQLFEGLNQGHFHSGSFGGGGREDSDDEEADTTRYYEILEVEKDASDADIKRAYRKKCRSLHPDRHPDEREKYQELFQELQSAYDVLKDPETRKVYDKYGEKAARSKSSSDMASRRSKKTKSGATVKLSPPISTTIECTLEDIYKGNTKKVTIEKRVADDSSKKCERCDGEGIVMMVQRMGPMMFKTQQKCSSCGGIGYSLKRVTAEVAVNIPIGAKHGESVTVPNEGNEFPGHGTGNVNAQLRVAKHDTFTRQGADLGMSYKISLRQAMLGFEIRVRHVSGSYLLVRSKPGDVIQPGAMVVVHTYGMPQRFSPHVKGHLYIAMEVELPSSLPGSAAKKLAALPFPKQEVLNPQLKEAREEFAESLGGSTAAEKGKSKKGKSKKKNAKKGGSAMDVDGGGMEEEVVCHLVEDGKIRATPAAARGYEDEDEGGQTMECRQM